MTTTSTPSIRIKPKGKAIVGRVVDFAESDGGINLVAGDVRNVTFFLLVEAHGPNVERCKTGDVIVFHKADHIYTRAGHHFLVVLDDEVIGVVEGLDMMRALQGEGPVTVEGVPRRSSNGGGEAHADA